MRIRSFDCLRGYGVISILLIHLPQLGHSSAAAFITNTLLQFSIPYLFLDIFFAMSGYLITGIILNEKEKGAFTFKNFYFKRALRIFPVYYLTLFFVCIFISPKGIIYPAFYLSNFYFIFHQDPNPLLHTWTLSVEEHFYLLWPVLLTIFNFKTCRIIIGYIIPGISLLTIALLPFFSTEYFASSFIYSSTITRCLAISLGSYLAFHKNWLIQLSNKKFLVITFLSILLYGIYEYAVKIPFLQSVPHYVRIAILFPLLAVLLLILIYKINFFKESILKKIVLNRVVNYTGKISYGLYLYHYPIFYYFKIGSNQIRVSDNIGLCILATGMAFGIASLSFHFIETPIMNYKKKVEFSAQHKITLAD